MQLNILIKKAIAEYEAKFANAFLEEKSNYIQDHMNVLSKLTRIAYKDGILDHFPFESVKGKTIKGKRKFLTQEELNKVMSTPTSTVKQAMVKDVFIFTCFTGLGFKDLALLRKQDLKPQTSATGNKTYRLSLRMKKTHEKLGFRLLLGAEEKVDIYRN